MTEFDTTEELEHGVKFEKDENGELPNPVNGIRENGLKEWSYNDLKELWTRRRDSKEEKLIDLSYSIERIKRHDIEDEQEMIEKREETIRKVRAEMMRLDKNIDRLEGLKTKKQLEDEWEGETSTTEETSFEEEVKAEAEATDSDQTPRHPTEDQVYQ